MSSAPAAAGSADRSRVLNSHSCIIAAESGIEHVTPVMYLPSEDDSGVMYVFGTKSGAPENPAWYHNLLSAGTADVEVGVDTFAVSVRELAGPERDRVYAEQARRYPPFGEYEQKTAGIRTIPVLELRRR